MMFGRLILVVVPLLSVVPAMCKRDDQMEEGLEPAESADWLTAKCLGL